MHRTSIICWEYAPYYPTGTADVSLQIVEYRLTHKCLSQTFNTNEHSAHYLEWVRVRLEKLTDTLMPCHGHTTQHLPPHSHHKWWWSAVKNLNCTPTLTLCVQPPNLHRKTKPCLLKLIQFLGTSLSDALVVVVFQHLSPCQQQRALRNMRPYWKK